VEAVKMIGTILSGIILAIIVLAIIAALIMISVFLIVVPLVIGVLAVVGAVTVYRGVRRSQALDRWHRNERVIK